MCMYMYEYVYTLCISVNIHFLLVSRTKCFAKWSVGFPGHVCVWGRGTGMIKGSLTHASISSVSFGSKKLPIIELDQVD